MRGIRRGRSLLRLLLSVGLLAFLLHRAGLASIGSVLGHAQPVWLVAALCLGLLSTAVQATQWRALLRASGLRRAWTRCLGVVFVGNVFNVVLPSSIGGDVARALVVADHPSERVTSASTVVLQRLCNLPGMVVLMAVGLVATAGDGRIAPARPVAIIGVAGGVVGLSLCMSPLLARLARLLGRLHGRIGSTVAAIVAAVDTFRGRRGTLLAASARGTGFWTLSVLNQWCFMHAVGIPIGLGYAAIVVTVVNAITMLPISINGYGVREGGLNALLTSVGLAATSQAVAVGFLLTGQSLLWAVVGLVLWWTPGVRRSRQARPEPVAA